MSATTNQVQAVQKSPLDFTEFDKVINEHNPLIQALKEGYRGGIRIKVSPFWSIFAGLKIREAGKFTVYNQNTMKIYSNYYYELQA